MTSPTPKVLTEADLAGLPRAVSHTPGKLIVRGGFSLYAEDRKTPVADACLNASIAAHDECNARRLAACWNALEGVPTEEIETVLIHGKALKDVVSERDALAGRVAELEHRKALFTDRHEIAWTDKDGVHHSMGIEGACALLEKFWDEWPGGWAEVEAEKQARAALSATTPESKP